ncbi:MAG: hypothetical protein AB7E37_07710 [Candidatus Altimarinota bacterium]
MKKIIKKNTQHKISIVSDLQNLVSTYLKKVKSFDSIFTLQSQKESIAQEIKALESEIEHKLKISSMMKGY